MNPYLPSAEDLDAVAEEERVRLATAGRQPDPDGASDALESLKWMARGAGVALLIDAALRLARLHIYVDLPTRPGDGVASDYCVTCLRTSLGGGAVPHAESCPVGHIFRLTAALTFGVVEGVVATAAEEEPDAFVVKCGVCGRSDGPYFWGLVSGTIVCPNCLKPARPLVTGHAEREIVLDPVEHPTPEELA
jgi:hypothetical protein